tara:strand:+ start:1923 stop:2291 length:369 start_codon:yes stop_codon:yes gene_type:complete
MRLIILTTLFLIPLIGFASFPIEITNPCDTTIESKKETMEEYKIRIQKQLYSNDNDLYNEAINQYESRKKKKNLSKWKKIHPLFRFLIIIVALVIALIIGVLISFAINPPSFSFDLDDFSNE